ncbi:MAG TPA: hypothetical protein VFF94_17410, partial [Novosphingobium sp.]|nr:hypothetical protein [Novosphingobium sp.]
MKPDVSLAAAELARRLREELQPELTGFRANTAGMGAAMLDMIADAWDGAAARLVAENRALRALLQRGGDALAPEAAEEDLRISALTAANDRLRGQLIALHARIEQAEGPAARDLERAIWAFLRASVAARQIRS